MVKWNCEGASAVLTSAFPNGSKESTLISENSFVVSPLASKI